MLRRKHETNHKLHVGCASSHFADLGNSFFSSIATWLRLLVGRRKILRTINSMNRTIGILKTTDRAATAIIRLPSLLGSLKKHSSTNSWWIDTSLKLVAFTSFSLTADASSSQKHIFSFSANWDSLYRHSSLPCRPWHWEISGLIMLYRRTLKKSMQFTFEISNEKRRKRGKSTSKRYNNDIQRWDWTISRTTIWLNVPSP